MTAEERIRLAREILRLAGVQDDIRDMLLKSVYGKDSPKVDAAEKPELEVDHSGFDALESDAPVNVDNAAAEGHDTPEA